LNEKKLFSNGYYRDEETAAHASDTLARKFMSNGEEGHKLNFPDDNTEVYPQKALTNSKYFGVSYRCRGKHKILYPQRWSKNEKKNLSNGTYKDEETAAHASDTLARELKANGEQGHTLNFPDDNSEVKATEKKVTSKYFGVSYLQQLKRWTTKRWSKNKKMQFTNGTHKDEKTAAHASDTLAKKLIATGEEDLRLNFPDDNTEVKATERTKKSKSFGVSYIEARNRWFVQRRSKNEKKLFNNGYYRDIETAAHASDDLARELMANGEQGQKLNFPDDHIEVQPKEQENNKSMNKRKRSFRFEYSQANENTFEKFE